MVLRGIPQVGVCRNELGNMRGRSLGLTIAASLLRKKECADALSRLYLSQFL